MSDEIQVEGEDLPHLLLVDDDATFTRVMALTNYLLQTLICITFFNVFGFYQHFDRLQLVALVPLVWVCNCSGP